MFHCKESIMSLLTISVNYNESLKTIIDYWSIVMNLQWVVFWTKLAAILSSPQVYSLCFFLRTSVLPHFSASRSILPIHLLVLWNLPSQLNTYVCYLPPSKDCNSWIWSVKYPISLEKYLPPPKNDHLHLHSPQFFGKIIWPPLILWATPPRGVFSTFPWLRS